MSYGVGNTRIPNVSTDSSKYTTSITSGHITAADVAVALTTVSKNDATILAVTLSMLLLCLALSLLLAVLYAHGTFGQQRNNSDISHADEALVLQNTKCVHVRVPESAFSFSDVRYEATY